VAAGMTMSRDARCSSLGCWPSLIGAIVVPRVASCRMNGSSSPDFDGPTAGVRPSDRESS
jgi:hypothetical protein